MKKSEIKKLDKVWSEKIRSKGACEVCHKTTSLNAHHIIGRRNRSVRWDLRNGVCLCAGCHKFSKLSAHQDPEWFHDWLKENRNEDLDYLRLERNKIYTQFYDEVIEKMEGV